MPRTITVRVGYSTTTNPVQFPTWTPGQVKPIGVADDPSGLTRNVGPRVDESALTVVNQDITLTASSDLKNLDIRGQLNGRGGRISDSIIRGRPNTKSEIPMVCGTSFNLGGAVLDHCRIDGTGNETGFLDCLSGGNFTASYCDLLRGVDGGHFNAVGNGTIENSRISSCYYMAWWNDATNSLRTTSFTDIDGVVWTAPFPAQSSGDVHADGIQIAGQSGWVIRGNYIGGKRGTAAAGGALDPTVRADKDIINALDQDQGFTTSCLMVNAVSTAPMGALIDRNWLYGGASRINMSTSGSDLLQGVTISNNRFIRSDWGGGGGYYIYAFANHQATLINNVYDDTGAAVPVTLH